MTAPIIYRWDDPGAPALSSPKNSFYEIVMACLINGYTGKPAAGWSVVYDNWQSSGHATITNVMRSGVLGMIRPTDAYGVAALYVADAMVDADTPVAAKSGSRAISDVSAVDANSESYQRAWDLDTPKHWVVIANENFVWMWACAAQGSLVGALADYNKRAGVFSVGFGSLESHRGLGSLSSSELGNFVIIGGYHNRKGGSYPYLYSSWASRFDNFNHSTIDIDIEGNRGGLYRVFLPTISDSTSSAGAMDSVNSKAIMRVLPLDIVASTYRPSDGWVVGTAKMILVDPSIGSSLKALATMNLLGKTQLLDTVNIDGRQCVIAQMTGGCPAFVSLAPEDWT